MLWNVQWLILCFSRCFELVQAFLLYQCTEVFIIIHFCLVLLVFKDWPHVVEGISPIGSFLAWRRVWYHPLFTTGPHLLVRSNPIHDTELIAIITFPSPEFLFSNCPRRNCLKGWVGGLGGYKIRNRFTPVLKSLTLWMMWGVLLRERSSFTTFLPDKRQVFKTLAVGTETL